MTIRDLTVYVDHGPHSKGAFNLALDLAERFRAHINAVYIDPIPLSPHLLAMSSAPQLMERLFEEQELRAVQSKGFVEEAVRNRDLRWLWRRGEGTWHEAVVNEGRPSDLIVLSQDGDGEEGPLLSGLAEHAVMGSGRPVLVVPYIGASTPLDGRVMVAWDGGGESARAACDALPLLSHSKTVEVVTIRPQSTALADADLPGVQMCEYLARHEINAESHVLQAPEANIADVLLSHAADSGANLLVMGAYGHSRMRELILGGATREILRHMTIPVLMSH